MDILDIENSEKFDHREYKDDVLAFFFPQQNLLDSTIEPLINSLKKEIDDKEPEIDRLTKLILPLKYMGEDWFQIFRAINPLLQEQEQEKEQLLALNEMRVIYLFKNLELSIKALIKKAYPTTNAKDFSYWESTLDFFKQKGIDIKNLDGYKETNELRVLNNNIKHSQSIGGEAKKIKEFKEREYLESENVEEFLQRIYPKVKIFQEVLIEEVKKELYDFSDERLNNIANEYFNRMQKDRFVAFIEKLNEKYK